MPVVKNYISIHVITNILSLHAGTDPKLSCQSKIIMENKKKWKVKKGKRIIKCEMEETKANYRSKVAILSL